MNLYAWSGLLGAITGLTIPLLVFFNSSKENKTISSLWVSLNIGVALYGLGIFFGTTTQNYDNALFWWRIAYLGIPLIAPFYFHHSYKLAGIKISKRLLSVVYGIGIFYLLLNIITPQFFVHEMRWVFNSMWYIDFLSPHNIISNISTSIFVAYFFSIAIAANYKLFIIAKNAHGNFRKQLYLFLVAGIIGFGGGGASYLPSFHIDIFPILNFSLSIYHVAVSYAIIRYGLYNTKVVAAEIFTVFLGLLFVVSLFAANNVILQSSVLVGFGVLAFLLIKSSLAEVRLASELKGLNDHLEQKVAEQTVEIKKAYEVEKKARVELEELDKAKDQFILTTQHHLRTPLTVIKGYIGVLKDLPSLPGEAVSAVNKIDNHADDLAKFINDLLQITEVEITKKDETKSD